MKCHWNAIMYCCAAVDGCRTLISKDDVLLTAAGKAPLPKQFTLGPLGELLMKGNPVPSSAYWNSKGQLVSATGSILSHLK
jgi:hypothetical protein